MKMNPVSEIRPSPIAGTWYTNNPQLLASEIDHFLNEPDEVLLHGEVIALLVPHAGYRYSGSTAGHAFRTIQGNSYELVIILSPYHPYHSGTILSTAHARYATPLGEVPVNQELLDGLETTLRDVLGIKLFKIINDQEHSLEIEIPFLQRALSGSFMLLPLMIRSLNPMVAANIAHEIHKSVAGRNTLVVISSDLSHFYPQEEAVQLDQHILEAIASFSEEAVYRTEQTDEGYACGLGAIQVGMALSRAMGADAVKILAHTTSAENSGDKSSVVGYGAAAILKTVEAI